MGANNGTYVPWHEPVWAHAKTKAAAAVLVADPKAKVPEECAAAIIGRALHALSCWALRDGDTGEIGRLSDGELAQIAWPEGVVRGRLRPAALGALLRRALHAGGFLEGPDGPGGGERIHDFKDHNRRVLDDRFGRRERRAKEEADRRQGGGASNDSRTTVGGASADSRQDVGGSRARPASEAGRLGDTQAERASDERPTGGIGLAPGIDPPTLVGPEPPGRSRRPGMPDPAPDPACSPEEAATRTAPRVQLKIGCSFVKAAEVVGQLLAWGMPLADIDRAALATPEGPQNPWTWRDTAFRAWQERTAPAEGIA